MTGSTPLPGEAYYDARAGYLYKWNNDKAWRLEKCTYQTGSLKMPPTDCPVEPDTIGGSFLLVGERGSGLTQFKNWYQKTHSEAQEKSLKEVARAGYSLERDPSSMPNHLILDLSGIDIHKHVKDVHDDLAELASLLDRESFYKDRKIVVLSFGIDHLQQDTLFTGPLTRFDTYRTPAFTALELQGWFTILLERCKQAKKDHLDLEYLAHLARWYTGGQPVLCRSFFEQLEYHATQHRKKVSQDLKQADLEGFMKAVAEQICTNGPHLAVRWQDALRKLLNNHPSTKSLLQAYCNQMLKPSTGHFDPQDTLLFMNGWIGEVTEDQWGIRSHCHRHWANQVLRGASL